MVWLLAWRALQFPSDSAETEDILYITDSGVQEKAKKFLGIE